MVRPSRLQGSIPGRQRQRGVAAVYAAISLIAGTSAMALAIDVGQLYYAQRDLQKLASSAAVDTARAFSGCYTAAGAPGTAAAVRAALDASLLNSIQNGGLPGDVKTVAEVELPYAAGVSTLEFGKLGRPTLNGVQTRAFVKLGATAVDVDSVQVNLARVAPTPLLPFIFSTAGSSGPITLRASAAAQQSPIASYSISTTLVDINNPAPLTPICRLLGGSPTACNALPALPASISVAGPGGLAGASLTLDQLAATLGVGTAGQLLTASLSANVLLNGIAATVAANANGNAAQAAAASALSGLAAAAGTAQVAVADLVGALPHDVGDQIGTLPINAADLLTQLSMATAAGLYPINLGVSPVNIPGVTVDTFLTLGSNPAASPSQGDDPSRAGLIGLGRSGDDANGNHRTVANAQQLKLLVRIGISTKNVPGLAVLGNAATVNIGIDVAGASATSNLASITCPAPVTGTVHSTMTIPVTTAPAVVSIGTFNPAAETAPVMGGNALTIAGNLVKITLPSPTPIDLGQGSGMPIFKDPYPSSQTVAVTNATLPSTVSALLAPLSGTVMVSASGLPIPLTGAGVVTAISPIVSLVVNALSPTIASLGIGLGGATVTARAVDFGTHAADTLAVKSTNSVPVLFNKDKPTFDYPVQVPPGTR